MKKLTLIFFCFCLVLEVYSQKIIVNPGFGFTTASYLTIKSVELRDTATVICFHAIFPGAIVVPKETYIQPANGKKFYVTAAQGIPLNERFYMPASGETDYKLYFPKINSSVSRLDYGEDGAAASWFIYDIALREDPVQSVVPVKLRSNWFNKKTGDWEFSFFDSTAVYKKKVWNYGKVNLINGEGTVELKNNKNRILLTLKPTDGGYLIGETTRPLYAYIENPDYKKSSEESFQSPVFKCDSVNLSGYFKGYSSRIIQKSITIHVDDILAGKFYSIVAKLDDKGVFSVKLPLYYPHSVSINSVSTGQQVFLEPGKDLFVLFDNLHNKKLYMGESATINRDLDIMGKFNSIDFTAISKKMPDLTSSQFKSECLDLRNKELNALDTFKEVHAIETKAYQVKKRDIEFKIATYLLQYNKLMSEAQLAKNKITGRNIVFYPEKFSAEFYDFIKNEKINDPLAVISTNYSSFMTQLEALPFFTGKELTYQEMMKALEDSRHSLSPEEIKLKEDLNISLNQGNAVFGNFFKYDSKSAEFFPKYFDPFESSNQKIIDFTKKTTYDYTTKKGVNYKGDEKATIEQRKSIDTLIIKVGELQKRREKFYSDHQEFLDSLIRQRAKNDRDENLGKLSIEKGLAIDILDAKRELRKIVSELTPISNKALNSIRSQFTTPFIADYLAMSNKWTREKIKSNKRKGGYIVNEVPKVEKEKLFEELMKKYAGKVVLIDFWATWCGPCRAGIGQIRSLKDEMDDDKVVFIYITNPSSPKQTFDNMVSDIKGEHYRVSNVEWQYLCSKFNFSAIPHQVLVDKKGNVINPDLNLRTNEALKKELEKRINE